MDMPKKQIVAEALIDLHRRLSTLPTRSHERRMIMRETANLYGVSEQSLYRALAQRARPRALRRSDRGAPRVLPQDKMEYYCELIAALKIRTSNKKGRHLSTGEAILAGEFASFADAVCTGKEPDVTGVDARCALAICFGIY
jgi:hypothetical protein